MAQHIYSLDSQGNPVYVEFADPKSTYSCPDCKGEMIVKNQGSIREHHFAHKILTIILDMENLKRTQMPFFFYRKL